MAPSSSQIEGVAKARRSRLARGSALAAKIRRRQEHQPGRPRGTAPAIGSSTRTQIAEGGERPERHVEGAAAGQESMPRATRPGSRRRPNATKAIRARGAGSAPDDRRRRRRKAPGKGSGGSRARPPRQPSGGRGRGQSGGRLPAAPRPAARAGSPAAAAGSPAPRRRPAAMPPDPAPDMKLGPNTPPESAQAPTATTRFGRGMAS